VVVVQPLRPPQVTVLARTRSLRPLLAGALGLTLLALPAADLHGDESASRVAALAPQRLRAPPVTEQAAGPDPAPPVAEPAADSGRHPLPASTPASTPASAPVGRAAQSARRAAAESTGWPEHEWRVAEAMRLRYRELYARHLVDWAAWQAREAEALRARRRWERWQANRGAGGLPRDPA
jgi:hypothetical protein